MRALLTALIVASPGCIIVYEDSGEWERVEAEPDPEEARDPLSWESEPLPFETFAFELAADRAVGWRFDRTQRHVGGVIAGPEGLARVTLSLTTPTGGGLDALSLAPAWQGELVDAQRVWLDEQPLDFVAWRGEDADWLELRGVTALSWLDAGGTTAVDAWVGEDRLTLVACGEAGLRVWTVDFAGTVLAQAATETPGDTCAVLAPYGEPMVLHGDTAGGPLTRYQLVDGALGEALVVHENTRADRVAAASAGDMALLALFDGAGVDLISAWGETRAVAEADLAEPLVVAVLEDGFTAVAWADGAGVVHAHWGSIDAGLESVAFTLDGPPTGLAVGLREEVVSIVALDGTRLVLGRQQP